jgi:hypothetical protein
LESDAPSNSHKPSLQSGPNLNLSKTSRVMACPQPGTPLTRRLRRQPPSWSPLAREKAAENVCVWTWTYGVGRGDVGWVGKGWKKHRKGRLVKRRGRKFYSRNRVEKKKRSSPQTLQRGRAEEEEVAAAATASMSGGIARGRLAEERKAWRKNHPHVRAK